MITYTILGVPFNIPQSLIHQELKEAIAKLEGQLLVKALRACRASGSSRGTPYRGPFLALLLALLEGTLLRGSISPRLALIQAPKS